MGDMYTKFEVDLPNTKEVIRWRPVPYFPDADSNIFFSGQVCISLLTMIEMHNF